MALDSILLKKMLMLALRRSNSMNRLGVAMFVGMCVFAAAVAAQHQLFGTAWMFVFLTPAAMIAALDL